MTEQYTQMNSMFLGDTGAVVIPQRKPNLYIFTQFGDTSKYNFLGGGFLPLRIAPASSKYANIALEAILSVDSPGSCPYYNAVHIQQLINAQTTAQTQAENSFSFTIPGDATEAANVIEGNLVGYKDTDGNFQLFEIQKVAENHADTSFKDCYSVHLASMELADDWIDNVAFVNADATTALTGVLDGTLWQVGNVTVTGTQSLGIRHTSALSGLSALLATWGGEIQFRVTISGNKVTGQYVDWLQTVGNNNGKRFVFGKDMVNVQRTILSQPKTAMYGYGQTDNNGNQLTFASIEWSTANGDPANKPAGQTWVGDPTALAQWGRENGKRNRFGQFQDSQQTDPTTLLQETWNYLETMTTPQITYQMDVVDLEQVAGYSFEAVRIGDTVVVIDTTFQPELRLTARVIEIQNDLIDPLNTTVTLGNFLPTIVGTQPQLKNLQQTNTGSFDGGLPNTYTPASPLPTSQLQGAISTLRNEVQSEGAYAYMTNDHGLIVYDKPVNQQPTKAIKLGGGILAIANSKTPAGLWNWSTFGTGDGFTADVFTGGTFQGVSLILGGKGNGNGQAVIQDTNGNTDITLNSSGIVLSNGATMVGGSGVLSELLFVSSGANQGWQNCGWYEYSSAVNTMALLFVYIPSNFTVESATFYSKHLPYYENDTIQKWWYLTNGQLMFGADADNAFYNGITDSYVQVNNMTDITSTTWGSYWNPSGTTVQIKSCDVTSYLTPGKRVAFGVNSHDSGVTSSGQISGMMQFELVVTGYKSG